jgi:predicted kinase
MKPLSELLPIPAGPTFAPDWPRLERALEGLVSPAVLGATAQDATAHAEGDVWTHTRLVVEALVAEPEWRALAEPDRAVTFGAALLHDVGKPSTTRREPDGRLTSRGHSRRGEQLVREWLWRLGAAFEAREAVCRLIRHHQVPFHALEREDPGHLAARLSLSLSNQALVVLALADARGRRCAEAGAQASLIERCELYRELCRDEGVLTGPRVFATEHTRVAWCEAQGRRAFDVPVYDDTSCEVTLMSGLPAAGKDHWLATQRPGLEVVSLDALRARYDVDPAGDQGHIVQAAREAARAHLREGHSFAWNATNLSEDHRGQVIELARAYRARVHLVYCEAGPDELARRNQARRDPVPAAAMRRMLERWSVPRPDEAHRVTYVVTQAAARG